jgi:poly(A) polymerase
LIERGLKEGPIVARTLKAIEERWVEAGFPRGEAFEKIVAEALASANPG